jgi:hypothetical protein
MQNESNNNSSSNNQTPAPRPLTWQEGLQQYSARRRYSRYQSRHSSEWEQDPDTGKWFPVADRE